MSDKSITMTMQQWSHVVSQSIQLAEAGKKCAAEREALRAEVERLKANAERYQWMKRVHADGDESVTAWIGYYPADQWDAEIDKHRADNEGEQRNE